MLMKALHRTPSDSIKPAVWSAASYQICLNPVWLGGLRSSEAARPNRWLDWTMHQLKVTPPGYATNCTVHILNSINLVQCIFLKVRYRPWHISMSKLGRVAEKSLCYHCREAPIPVPYMSLCWDPSIYSECTAQLWPPSELGSTKNRSKVNKNKCQCAQNALEGYPFAFNFKRDT